MADAPATTVPRVFGIPPGADFPEHLAHGLIARLRDEPPEALARVTIYLTTQRLRRRLRAAFITRGATFLPRMRLVGEISADPLLGAGVAAVSGLERRLELAVLIRKLLDVAPDLAPHHALYDLADSLAALLAEVQSEAVPPGTLGALDVGDHAAHWGRAQRFLTLIERFLAPDARPDGEGMLRRATTALIYRWQEAPPPDPVIVAGSTGSRGTTLLLMQAVAALPRGVIVLPGFDVDLPGAVWATLTTPAPLEDHPQFRHARLAQRLGIDAASIRPWSTAPPPAPGRNALISLALRPPPVTDQWISDGPALGPLAPLADGMTLIEAPDLRAEAQAIALALRDAVAADRRAALITPDRNLARRVSAALDRWRIRPDDSAGQPLNQTPPGRLLRMISRAMGRPLPADELLALLKHPLAFAGDGNERGNHLLMTRELELSLRRRGPAFPDAEALAAWAEARNETFAVPWAHALGAFLAALGPDDAAPLGALIARHRALAEMLARGGGGNAEALWARAAGAEALATMEEFAAAAPDGFLLTPADYAGLLDGVLSRRQVRDAVTTDERIEILGTQEARAQGADVVILAGLNEGVWPADPPADPWLNRRMRKEAGLLSPERATGLSAHDFQIAAGAEHVIFSRALRDAEAETVPSRWLNRLVNLMNGLDANGGVAALAAMRTRGAALMARARAVERPLPLAPAARPSPMPPVAARPRHISLTGVERLIRDPYAIYAQMILRLRPLAPLRALADARLRGEVLHRVPERLLRRGLPDTGAVDLLLAITDEVLAESVPWAAARALWRARMAEIAASFIAHLREKGGTPVVLERKYEVAIPDLDFRLIGRPDRIDIMDDGSPRIIDYKTGKLPSHRQQEQFTKQLHLAAVMAMLGAFPGIRDPSPVHIAYVALASGMKRSNDTLSRADIERALDEFRRLVRAYLDESRGYTSRRAVFETRFRGDYDDLARHGEWDATSPPAPEPVGRT